MALPFWKGDGGAVLWLLEEATMAYTGPGPGDKNSTRRQLFCLAASTPVIALTTSCRPNQNTAGPATVPRQVGCRSRLEWYHPFPTNEVRYEVFQQAIRSFTATRPGCAVEMIFVPSGELLTKLTATVAGGTPPALTAMAPSGVSSWSSQGVLAPVDNLFARDKLNSSDFPAPLWKQMNYGVKVWFLPLECNADFVLHWNKEHFAEAGLNPDQGPITIAELDSFIVRLTRERGGEYERLGMQPWDLYGLGNTFQAWGYAFGGSFFDEAKDEPTLTHPRLIRAVEWFTGWAHRLGVERVNRLREAANIPGVHFFGSGLFSIHVLTSSGLRGVLRYNPAIQIGAGPMPGEPPGQPGTVSIGGWTVAAVAGSTQREEAWDFMKYIGASDEGTLIIARGASIPGWLRSPGLAELSKDPLQKAYVDGIRRAQTPQLGYYFPAGLNLNPIQEVIDGKRGVRDALEAINRDANVRYQEWKRQVKKGA
jgi:multiple sugar transport system substrate-binding protein